MVPTGAAPAGSGPVHTAHGKSATTGPPHLSAVWRACTASHADLRAAPVIRFQAGRTRPRFARRIPDELAAIACGLRVRPAPHHSITGALVGLGVVVALALIARVVRGVSMHMRPSDPVLRPVGREVPRDAVLLTSHRAQDAAALRRVRTLPATAGIHILTEASVRNPGHLVPLLSGPPGHPLLVIAAGSDGTVRAAAELIAGSEHAFGIITLGTSNDIARSLRLPLRPTAAATALSTGTLCAIDAGEATVSGQHTRHFVHAATAGFNAVFARHASSPTMRDRLGRLTYPFAALVAFRYHRSFDCDLRIDQAPAIGLRLVHLAVVNTPIFDGLLGLRLTGSCPDDGMLDVVAVEHLPVRRLVRAAFYTLACIRRPVHGVHAWRARYVHVHTIERLEMTLDGEIAGTLPAGFEVRRHALQVIVPPAAAKARQPLWNRSLRTGSPTTASSRGPAGTTARSCTS